jgi:plastocyanin
MKIFHIKNSIQRIINPSLIGLFIMVLCFFVVSSACHKKSNSTPTPVPVPGANEVWMQNTAFNPATITISVNTTIKWINKDGFAHTVTSDGSLFDSGTINSNGTYSHQFTAIGTFPYRCILHSGMTGKVIVQ